MKRFFCKECKKVRRARKFPRNLTLPSQDNQTLAYSDVPADIRVGLCKRHQAIKDGGK